MSKDPHAWPLAAVLIVGILALTALTLAGRGDIAFWALVGFLSVLALWSL